MFKVQFSFGWDPFTGKDFSYRKVMRLACQPTAVRANKEDGVDGRFFAKRFDCERLETEVDVLNCSLYVDLNWIRAGMAETPEQSRYTSAFDRIQARWHDVQRGMHSSAELACPAEADDWLAPIFLDERADAYAGPEASRPAPQDSTESTCCHPLRSARVSNMGFLPMALDQYLSLLDTVGRVVRLITESLVSHHTLSGRAGAVTYAASLRTQRDFRVTPGEPACVSCRVGSPITPPLAGLSRGGAATFAARLRDAARVPPHTRQLTHAGSPGGTTSVRNEEKQREKADTLLPRGRCLLWVES